MNENLDWNQRYVDADTPWDSGVPSHHLRALIAEGIIKPCRVLELGCGTGTNAIFLAQEGFQVTAVDLAEEAISRAKSKAEKASVKVEFLKADVTALPDLGAPFSLVFDRGTYHIVRKINLAGYQSMLEKVIDLEGLLLVLAGNANEDLHPEKGPPRVSASELCAELEGSCFDLLRLNESNFHGVRIDGEEVEPLSWAALLKRRATKRA